MEEMSAPTQRTLYGVWGFAADDVIAVGEYGTVIRYDGDSWRSEDCGTSEHLRSVWGTSTTDIFAAGSLGTVVYYGLVE